MTGNLDAGAVVCGEDGGVTEPEQPSVGQRLYEEVTSWSADTGPGPAAMIDAAAQALIGGLDSPALRELAGASARDPAADLREPALRALEELAIPRPGTMPPGHSVPGGGGIAFRVAGDALRLAVTLATSGFQVEVHVNGVEMTSAGAGLGMDPYDLLVPVNRLVATEAPGTVPIARCDCGTYGCGSTDVTIVRRDDTVHWDWSIEVPMARGVSFAAADYDAEVARVAADHSWETPERTAGRLVLTGADRPALLRHGLELSWAATDHPDPEMFRVALRIGHEYQVFLEVAWRGRPPAELAREVGEILTRPPQTWRASWHAVGPGAPGPPAMAGRSWAPYPARRRR